MKFLLVYLSLYCVFNSGNFATAEIDSKNTQDYDELLICDQNRVDLAVLKTGNEYLKLHFGMMEDQLNKHNKLLIGLVSKFENFQQSFENMQEKLLEKNKKHFSELTDFIHNENQRNRFLQQIQPNDGRLQMLSDMKQVLEKHENLLENINEKQKNTNNLLVEANLKYSTPVLADVSKSLTVLEKIDKKLTNIQSGTTTKRELIEFRRNIESHFNKNETHKICLPAEDIKLVCNSKTYPTSCANFDKTFCGNNKCRIHNQLYGPESFLVACDDQSDGGGWTVIQRRMNGSVDFYRFWSEYKDGFGDIDGEFFIGLDKLHALTTSLQPVELLIQLKDFNDTMKYAKYDAFLVGNEQEKYILKEVGSYSGNAGDSFSQHQGSMFTTKDKDNDAHEKHNCAESFKGAWWYENCLWSNLNGKYFENAIMPDGHRGISWGGFHGHLYSMKFVQMMIRPKKL